MHARDLTIGMRVVCDDDAGTVEWINVETNDSKVKFDDDNESAYVHPSDLKVERI